MPGRKPSSLRKFKTAERSEVPVGRKGKHHEIVNDILKDLEKLDSGLCLKIPLSELPDGKANIRSALNRATRTQHKSVATATDDVFLYVWNT
ncbi:MAG TPA: hypothetical protein VKB58_13720 [Terriglobales bacterium]|jgi:hypothetical protein|nr:hypothetical protein [Terriglobales bacterium]